MKILHLSDLHYGLQAFGRTSGPASHAYATSLADSIVQVLDGQQLSWLVISGDITQRAGADEFAIAQRELLRLSTRLGVPHTRLVLCPGNHDVDWAAADLDAQLGTSKKLDGYRGFLAGIYGDDLRRHYPGYPTSLVGVHGDGALDTCIVSMSSCELESRDSPYGYVGKGQLDDATRALRASDARHRIAVLHHHLLLAPADVVATADGPQPPGIVSKLDMSIARDAGMLLRGLGEAGVELTLHGHKHDPAQREHRYLNGRGPRMAILGAGSAGVVHRELPPGRSHHGYLIDLDLDDDSISLSDLRFADLTWTIAPPRVLWQRYDELDALLRWMTTQRVGRAGAPRILDMVNTFVASGLPIDENAQAFMDHVVSAWHPAKKNWHDIAFWWLVVRGFLEFDVIDYFFDGNGDTWEQGIDYVHVSRRGRALLHRLRDEARADRA